MRYSNQDKSAYIDACKRYNATLSNAKDSPGEFVVASVLVHAARGTVPQRWRTFAFIRRMGQ